MSDPYRIEDVTMVIGLRAHDGNPWALRRLELTARHYDPMPAVVVADLGSPPDRRGEIRRICDRAGMVHLELDDTGVFSQAVARNAGAARAETDLLFFNDIDCLGEADLFARLLRLANALDLRSHRAQLVSLPAYHLTEPVSREIMEAQDQERDSRLTQALVASVDSAMGTVAEYVDPFSNFFLCHRDFFSLSGGYDETFRGHGSEDYELLIRMMVHSGQFPMPSALVSDRYGPTRAEFFGPKAHEGFRRLGELAAYQAETSGCRIAHLYHPRSEENAWYRNNDWKRRRFEAAVAATIRDETSLLERDWLAREKRAVAIVGDHRHARQLLMLRLDGYALDAERVAPGEVLGAARRCVEKGDDPAVACVIPTAANARAVRSLRAEASRRHVELLLLREDAGGGPGTRPFADSSYAAGRLGVGIRANEWKGTTVVLPRETLNRLPPHVAAEPAARRAARKLRKLWVNPQAFFSDARANLRRWLEERAHDR